MQQLHHQPHRQGRHLEVSRQPKQQQQYELLHHPLFLPLPLRLPPLLGLMHLLHNIFFSYAIRPVSTCSRIVPLPITSHHGMLLPGSFFDLTLCLLVSSGWNGVILFNILLGSMFVNYSYHPRPPFPHLHLHPPPHHRQKRQHLSIMLHACVSWMNGTCIQQEDAQVLHHGATILHSKCSLILMLMAVRSKHICMACCSNLITENTLSLLFL